MGWEAVLLPGRFPLARRTIHSGGKATPAVGMANAGGFKFLRLTFHPVCFLSIGAVAVPLLPTRC